MAIAIQPDAEEENEVGLGKPSMSPSRTAVPPPAAVGQDYQRRSGVRPPRKKRTAGVGRPVAPEDRINWGKVATTVGGALIPPRIRQAFASSPTGAEKKAAGEEEQVAASAAARTRSPEGQPPKVTPRDSTNTGRDGPTREPTDVPGAPRDAEGRVVELPGDGGFIMLHGSKPDPATAPGGFAHPGAKAADPSGRLAQDERIAALPESGAMERGPEGATGGSSWTLRTPGRQEAQYETARYRQETRGRQKSEDAALAELDARAGSAAASLSRSRVLEEDPMSPERAEMTGDIYAERARAQPKMERMGMASELVGRYNERVAAIRADTTLDEETMAQKIQEAQQEYWMILAGFQPTARKPQADPFAMGLPRGEEDA